MGLNLMILNMVYVISFTCSLYIGVTLFKIGKNSLAIIYCFAYCLLCCNALSGIVFHNNLASAPKAFCFFQGYSVSCDCDLGIWLKEKSNKYPIFYAFP